MDIDKLIERLRTESLYKDKATLEIMDLCMEAADAISALRDGNKKLQAEVRHWKNAYYQAAINFQQENRECNKILAELKQVKRERDAAVECIQFIATYLELNSTKDIRKTIEAWKSGLKEG